jgi:hypothetical protein
MTGRVARRTRRRMYDRSECQERLTKPAGRIGSSAGLERTLGADQGQSTVRAYGALHKGPVESVRTEERAGQTEHSLISW